MKIKELNESTTSGSIATVVPAQIGKMQKRAGSLFKGTKTDKPFYEEEDKPTKSKSKKDFGALFKKKVDDSNKEKKDTQEKVKALAVKEDEIVEQDLILVPGQMKGKDNSFIPHAKDRRDHEVEMARSELFAAAKDAQRIYAMLKNRSEDEGLMGWQQSYITLAADYLNSVADSIEHQAHTNEMTGGVLAGGMSNFEEGVAEGGAETSWSDGTEKITLQDILELTKHIKQINLPIDDNLKSKLLHWDGNPEEIERINQVTVSKQFPILVMLDGQGQIDWILDGNHRLHKAIKSQAKTIPAKLIKPSDLDDKAKRVFHIGVAEGKRIARKPGQPANSKKHSDLYTDENPKGTITGLKFATADDARASVSKIRNSGRSHAHKIQAAVAMEQRAKAAGKSEAAGVYRKFINSMKEKTDEARFDATGYDRLQGLQDPRGHKPLGQNFAGSQGKEILKVGTIVRVPHKGKIVPGKIVRYDPGKGGESPAYVVDIGEYESKIVPVHNVKQGVAEGEVISMRDDRKVLSRLVSDWWNGDEKQHTKASIMFSKMGYEPYEDGDDIVLSKGNEEIRFSMDEIQESLDEAEKLKGVSQRLLPKDEIRQYLDRVMGEPVLDKDGNPKLDKKGNPVVRSLKTKTDKYKYPYIHRSNVPIVSDSGEKYDLDTLASMFKERPNQILKQNEKMQHSDGTASQFYNVGMPALIGLAVDEDTNEFVVINTCPGAGSCKLVCYAMKGGYVQWKASSLGQTRMLNFLYNDPDGFMDQLENEIASFSAKNAKKKIKTIIRWHDAGDFFSQEYLDKAYNLAKKFPDVDFYAYTKLASVAQGDKPNNFKMNFSMGAQPSQEKKIDFAKTKNSRIVPEVIFADALEKDKNGKWQYKNTAAEQAVKDRIAKKYSLDPKSIITYDEMMEIPVSKDEGNKGKYNVIVKPGDGDDAANRNDVLSSLLLIH